jgi:hypothetical protein
MWTTGPVELCMSAMRLQALHRAPPQQLTVSVVKPEGGPAVSVKLGQKLCEIKWDYHIVGTTA